MLPFWLNFDPAASGIALVDERAAVRALHGRPRRCSTGSSPGCSRPPSPPACWPRAGRVRDARVGRRRGRSSPARCWPRPTWPASPCSRPCSRVALGAALSPRAGRPRALPLAAGERRPGLRDRARARLRARRVRRQRPVPHEHGLQARLPGVAAAGARRRLRAAVGGRAPAAAGVAGVGGGRGRAAAARPRLPLRRHLRAQGRLRALAVARRARVAAADRARRSAPRSTGCAPTRPATRSCSRRWGRTTRPSATPGSRRSAAARPCSAGPGHELQWDHDAGQPRGGRPHALHDRRPRRRRAS